MFWMSSDTGYMMRVQGEVEASSLFKISDKSPWGLAHPSLC